MEPEKTPGAPKKLELSKSYQSILINVRAELNSKSEIATGTSECAENLNLFERPFAMTKFEVYGRKKCAKRSGLTRNDNYFY